MSFCLVPKEKIPVQLVITVACILQQFGHVIKLSIFMVSQCILLVSQVQHYINYKVICHYDIHLKL